MGIPLFSILHNKQVPDCLKNNYTYNKRNNLNSSQDGFAQSFKNAYNWWLAKGSRDDCQNSKQSNDDF